MGPLTTKSDVRVQPSSGAALERMRALGRRAAADWSPFEDRARADAVFAMRSQKVKDEIPTALKNSGIPEENRTWLHENSRVIRTALREIEGLSKGGNRYPVVEEPKAGGAVPRCYAVAHAFLDAASEILQTDELEAFLAGLQEKGALAMREIWALKPTLQLVILERIPEAAREPVKRIPSLINSLRAIGEAEWKTVFEACNVIDPVLRRDPVGVYAQMDYESRELYRKALASMAFHSKISEPEIARRVVDLAEASKSKYGTAYAAANRRAHIGYYLIDGGAAQLKADIGYKPSLMQRLRDLVLKYPNGFYLVGIEIMTFLVVVLLLIGLDELTPIVAGFFLLLLPATQAAVDFMNHLTTWILPPRQLPKLDLSNGIPHGSATMVAVPTLLLNEAQIRELVNDLEIRYLANSDPELFFALVTDWPDAPQETMDRDNLVDVCRHLIEDLNRHYGSAGRTPFYMFHRHRMFNPREGAWMGWERKRGKLLDLNQLLRGGFDSFPVKVGTTAVLPTIRYVITLDSDTQLPRDAAQRLIGTLAHPLNRAVIDPRTNMVVEGYGILQPRIGVSIQSAARSRLASIYSGQTGFDIYTRAISDVYQDLYGEGIFTGKGIYDVDAFRTVLERRFPENWLLSHDLIEGAYARAALVSDIELIDDYPSHFSAYSRRKHRWVRGDWQILRWLFASVPNADNKRIPNPTNLISRWKMLDNARRSLFDPATLLLLLAGWFYLPGEPWYWTLASLAMLLIPVYAQLLFSILRAKRQGFGAWLLDTARTFLKGHFTVLLHVTFLLHQALLALDAIGRSLLRTFVTKRKLLEWETAAEAESTKRKKSTVDVYLEWSPLVAVVIGFLVWWLRPEAFRVALPIVSLWFGARFISAWLNRAPRLKRNQLTRRDHALLRETALRTWRFFREHSGPHNNWLIPDNVRKGGVAVNRLSPTNLGFLLNSRIAAVHFGYLGLPEFARETRLTLETVLRLPRCRGHLYNWYDLHSLLPLDPLFVSTVDSGNLAGCLWTLKQAARAWNENPPSPELLQAGIAEIKNLIETLDESSAEREWWERELEKREEAATAAAGNVSADLHWISDISHNLVSEMDCRFLYQPRKKVLSIGYDARTDEVAPSSYDLLASESRIGGFIAVAKGEVPQQSWFHLGRKHVLVEGQKVLMSWTGTMFEYLMPAIWMRHYRDTIMEQSLRAAVSVQRSAGRKFGVPWGISESACGRDDSCDYGYAAFGIPELAMKRVPGNSIIISPYSSFLALHVDPKAAVNNAHRMASLGWTGELGFIEAVDYGPDRKEPHPIPMWMAHHQGMILLSICNLLHSSPLQNYFHSEPHVLATELLLHERVPRHIVIHDEEPVAAPVPAAASA
jgi:hypothetical protein